MGKLSNLQLEEFSIVRGSDVQPANPGAKVLAYKTTQRQKESNSNMAKDTAPAPKAKSLAGQIGDAVKSVLAKAQQTRTTTSSYTSESHITETIDDGGAPAANAPDDGSTTIVITDAVEKSEPAPVVKMQPAAAPAASAEETVAAVTKAMEPLVTVVDKIDERLTAIEKRSVGSQRLKSMGAIGGDNPGGPKFAEFTKYLAAVSGLTPGQRLTKATISTSGWSYGLALDEATAFIDYVVDQSVLLKKIRTVQMKARTQNIDKIGLGGKVLVKGVAGTDPGDTVSISGPTQVQLVSSEVIGIVSVGDDALEDNIEGEAFLQHLLKMIAASAANELEQAAIHGDTSVSDTGILDRWDGWYKLAKAAGAHVKDAMDDSDRYWPGTDGGKATKLLKSLPSKYRQDTRNLAWLLNSDLYLDYNEMLAAKGYGEAFASITGVRDLPLRGIQNVQVPLMKTDMAFTHGATPYTDGTIVMLTDLRNLIFGIQRDIRIEPFRQPRKRATDYVLTMRAAVQIENGDAIAIYDHAAVKA